MDVLIFNPPYVPTEAEEEAQAQLEARRQELRSQRQREGNPIDGEELAVGGLDAAAAWAGGETGTRLLKELIGFGGRDPRIAMEEDSEGEKRGIEVSIGFDFSRRS